MASAAAELFVKVTANTTGLTDGMDDAARAIDHLGEEAKKAEQPLVRFRDIVAGSAVGELLADGIRSAASAMVNMGTQSIKLAGELEQNKVAFTTMLGGAEQADKMLRELATFAANTPFELRGLTDSTKKLLAFGFDAQSVIPIMNSVGNAVAAVGGGKEVLDGVTLALGQIAAKGKVSAEEMNQLAERGIPAWKMLADGIGVSIPEAMKRAEKGSIDAGTAITALVNGMNQKFPGMMAKQSQTIMGALSNLQDSADAALTKIGQKLIETFNLTRVVQQMSVAIGNLTAAFTSGGLIAALDMAFGPTTKAAIVGLGVAITAAMVPAITSATASLIATAAAAAPFLALAGAIAFAAFPIIKYWGEIRGTITALWDTAAQYTAAYYNRAVRIVSDLASNFATAFQYIGDTIRSILGDELTNRLLGGLRRTAGAFRGFAETAVTPLRAVGSVASAVAGNFAETWRGAMSMSQGFTSGLFNQAAQQSRDFGKVLTREMLGIGQAAAAAATGATKAAGAVKAKGQAAKEAAAHVRKLAEETNRLAFQTFEAIADAETKLRRALAGVGEEARKQGPAFDEAGARAEVYAASLKDIEAAWGSSSQRAVDLRAALEAATKASENGGAANAAAYRIIRDGSAAFDEAALKARVLGQEFDATGERVKQIEADLAKMVNQGIKPGTAAFDEHTRKLEALRKEQERQPAALKDLVTNQNSLLQSIKEVSGGLFDLSAMLGIEVPAVVKAGAAALVAGAVAVGVMTLAVQGLTAAWATFTAAFAANPIGAVLLAAGAAIVGIVSAVKAVLDEQKKAADEAAAALKKADEEAQRVRDSITGAIASGFKSAAREFMNGVDTWGEKLRSMMRDKIIEGVLDVIMAPAMFANLTELYTKVVAAATDPLSQGFRDAVKAFADGVDEQMKRVEPALKAARDVINTYLPETAAKIDEQAAETKRAAARATASASGIDSKSREALSSYQSNLLAAVQRLLNQGADNPASPLHGRYLLALDQANKAAADIRGMATGGLVTGPTFARLGEGGRDEAVLPLNDRVYSSIAQGIADAGASGTQVVINYTGNGKWTREDAQGLGRLLVAELRSMGVRA